MMGLGLGMRGAKARLAAPLGARPTWNSVGTTYASAELHTGGIQHRPAWPATVAAGDLGLCVMQTGGESNDTSLTLHADAIAALWAQIANVGHQSTRHALAAARKIAVGDEDSAQMTGGWSAAGSQTMDFTLGAILRFIAAGGFHLARPVVNIATSTQTGTTHAFPTLAGVMNGLAVEIIGQNDDDAMPTDPVAATGGTWTLRANITTTTGRDGRYQVWTAPIGPAGITGGTMTVPDLPRAAIRFVLRPGYLA